MIKGSLNHDYNPLRFYPPPPELSDSPAGPPVWRRLARGFLPALLLAPLFSLLAPAALAQTLLLDNIGGFTSGATGSDEYATPFTTGTHPYGYTIPEVVIFLSSDANASNPALVATIRERGSGNRPGDLVATLINPSNIVASVCMKSTKVLLSC
ncbi:MAG: hypothetical protein OXE78_02795 [Gammaproteobacteria bacterium]|nr:hypothetical protein [Gammaproteobacteria bacterium]